MYPTNTLHMAFSICEVFMWLVCPVVGLLRHVNDFAMLKAMQERNFYLRGTLCLWGEKTLCALQEWSSSLK